MAGLGGRPNFRIGQEHPTFLAVNEFYHLPERAFSIDPSNTETALDCVGYFCDQSMRGS